IRNEIYRMFSVYWNTKEFFQTYSGGEPEKPEELKLEDRWILSRVNSLTEEAQQRMNDCVFHELTRDIEDFIIKDLSRWYVKKVRSRVKNGDRSASWTLEKVLKRITLLMAPFSPYITEKVYQDISGEKLSVHMEDYPEPESARIDEELEESMKHAREVVEKATKIRDENRYNLKWPAKRLVISGSGDKELQEFEELIMEMANVKKIEYGEVASKLTAEPDYSKLGPKFGENAEEVARKVEKLDHEKVEQLREVGEIELQKYQVEAEDVDIASETSEDVGSKSVEIGEIYLDLQMTDEIEKDAFLSEVLRAIQQKRKEAELDVEDSINLSFSGDTEPIEEKEDRIRERMNVSEIDCSGEKHQYSGEVEFKGRKAEFSFTEPVA
ncbi:MAG: hypothetical protein BRC26_01950, partial [Nanohaloarchaea archaeon QH_8_44_6]